MNKIGIIGIGFVGNAIKTFFNKKNTDVYCYDKYIEKYNNFNNILNTEILFLCLPTLYLENEKEYDKYPLEENIKLLSENHYNGIILIKSTIEPTTTKYFNDKYNNLQIIHNPEFLSAKTAIKDFENQNHIIIGFTDKSKSKEKEIINFFKFYFPHSEITISNSNESETIKICCNSFYCVKIQFFNEIYDLCNKIDIDYNVVKDSMIKNGWINKMHTSVPGSDGKLSYAGACFPKDTNALLEFMKKNNIIHDVLESTIIERNNIRQ
jgi:nucleotide sugar dehydrogenase